MIAALLGAALLQTGAPPPVRVSSGSVPDTVTVGDRFRVAVRLYLPAGTRVRFPYLSATDTLRQVAGTLAAAAPGAATAAYPMVAWVAGSRPTRTLPVEVISPDGRRTRYAVPLRMPYVRSVLPRDTTGLRPKPAHALLPLDGPAERDRLLILAVAVLAALAALAWLYRRRRPPPEPELDPREEALRSLAALRRELLDPQGGSGAGAAAYAEAYTRGLDVLRAYAASLSPAWSRDLTAGELAARLGADGAPQEATAALRSLVARAEPVKFAGAAPGAADADRFWSDLEAWIAGFPPASGPERQEAA